MKDIQAKLVELLQKGYCVPKISRIAKETNEPSSTIHYNIDKLEEDGVIKTYKAVFDYEKIDKGFCTFVLVTLKDNEYGDPETVGRRLAKFDEIESVDICTGDWELVLKVRVKDKNEYYEFVKDVLEQEGVKRTKSLVSFKQLKTEFVESS